MVKPADLTRVPSPGDPDHKVAPFEPADGKVTEAVVHTYPLLTPEEADWKAPDTQTGGIIHWLKMLLSEQRKTRAEGRIAAQLEPRDWQTYEVQVAAGTTMKPLVGSVKNRRDINILNSCGYTVNVAPTRTQAQGALGFPIAPGGNFTLRTRGAIFGCAPTAPGLSSTSQGVLLYVQVTEELY